jgi:hypothetical protein
LFVCLIDRFAKFCPCFEKRCVLPLSDRTVSLFVDEELEVNVFLMFDNDTSYILYTDINLNYKYIFII